MNDFAELAPLNELLNPNKDSLNYVALINNVIFLLMLKENVAQWNDPESKQ